MFCLKRKNKKCPYRKCTGSSDTKTHNDTSFMRNELKNIKWQLKKKKKRKKTNTDNRNFGIRPLLTSDRNRKMSSRSRYLCEPYKKKKNKTEIDYLRHLGTYRGGGHISCTPGHPVCTHTRTGRVLHYVVWLRRRRTCTYRRVGRARVRARPTSVPRPTIGAIIIIIIIDCSP